MRYRKKPVVVEAYKTNKEIVIHTLEGNMKASIGDYIITGVNGEKYPCKPDIFEKTYEAVNNTNYDRIKAMSVEELADFIYDAADKICFENCTKDTGNKFQCHFGEDVTPERCVECMKHYLEREVQGGMIQFDLLGNEVEIKPKQTNKEKRNWENAFQRWSNDKGMNAPTEHYGKCGYGSMCDYCEDNTYGRPCVRALNEMCRDKHIIIDYTDRNFEDIWNGELKRSDTE